MSKLNKGLFTSSTDEWATPDALFDELHAEFSFSLDACATNENAKCERFYTKEQDGLIQPWAGERVFCNPPYGRELPKWVAKAFDETHRGGCDLCVLLIPARTDTAWFHDYVWVDGVEIRFIRRRIRFGGSQYDAPFPSMLVVYRGGV